MTTNTIVDRAIAGSGHRAKKTAVFLQQMPKIEESLARGASVRGLYRELKKDGHDVGSLTWFRDLVAKHLRVRSLDAKDVVTAQPQAASAPAPAPSASRFGDGRFTPDYE